MTAKKKTVKLSIGMTIMFEAQYFGSNGQIKTPSTCKMVHKITQADET